MSDISVGQAQRLSGKARRLGLSGSGKEAILIMLVIGGQYRCDKVQGSANQYEGALSQIKGHGIWYRAMDSMIGEFQLILYITNGLLKQQLKKILL